MRRGLIASNPFDDVSAGTNSNDENAAFIERDIVAKVMAVTADNGWKLLIALSRYGGLRIPSEIKPLRWEDVLWSNDASSSTRRRQEKVEGKAVRIIPLSAELEPLLQRQFKASPDGVEYVLSDRSQTLPSNDR